MCQHVMHAAGLVAAELVLSVASPIVSPCLVMHVRSPRTGQVMQLKRDVRDFTCRWMPCAVLVEMGTTRLQGV